MIMTIKVRMKDNNRVSYRDTLNKVDLVNRELVETVLEQGTVKIDLNYIGVYSENYDPEKVMIRLLKTLEKNDVSCICSLYKQVLKVETVTTRKRISTCFTEFQHGLPEVTSRVDYNWYAVLTCTLL